MPPNGSKWSQMAQNGPNWPQMVPNGPKFPQMVPNYPNWCQMAPNGSKWPQLVWNGPKWSQVVPNGPKWSQMAPNGSTLTKIVPNLSVINLPVSCWFDYPEWAKLTLSATGLEFWPDRAWNSSGNISFSFGLWRKIPWHLMMERIETSETIASCGSVLKSINVILTFI